ncbi:MAG: CbiX/SirB N-terminal domain-containing protein [Gammaproteobacteria bacterium]|nr:CbiX/SirB N-terminal domain-containing protein [Gammaproteobacteria bacterium]
MKGLLLVAHGSRKEESNLEIGAVTQRVKYAVVEEYSQVAFAFLELAQPDIATAADELVGLGCSEITVVPYFLAAGSHVVRDIPARIDEVALSHPTVQWSVSPHIGASPLMAAVVAGSAAASSTTESG